MASGDQRPPRARVPEAVARKRPAQIITAPPPGSITGPLPPTPEIRGRSPFRLALPGRMPKPQPIRGRKGGMAGVVALVLLFVGLFVVGLGLGFATGFDVGSLFRGPDEPPPRAFPVLEPSRPQRLEIPAIRVSAPILEVGLAGDGSVGVPPLRRHNEAGWFEGGPTPGQFGPALIVGHADTRTGPSVFHRLDELRPGQEIRVSRQDGSIAVFKVNSVETFDKGSLPAERVYGDYTRPSLRLMTCGGRWLGGEEGYEDNIVVFASLVDSRDA
ncbi:class F sortase [Actinoplanes xinjiangensis]|uniref:Sortase family protein n=1 Tax=Actinoplanes xinjiangensis TaxID=512350 RepID=A0A316FBJ0_9ACTN|nr:class F sortase [Actinoplanes xinjiangensis]PWK46248.1 sortase family protein [Actinoplanes xinjiangensis]